MVWAAASSNAWCSGVGAGGASPGNSGSGATTVAISSALSAARRAPSREKSFDAATPMRPSETTRTRIPVSSRWVLWWIELEANRVSPPHSCMNRTSTPSARGRLRAASATRRTSSGPMRPVIVPPRRLHPARPHQPRTPSCTFRNLEGDAPWPTRATWPGWPLPQFGVPHSVQSSRPPTASHEPQNSVVMPV